MATKDGVYQMDNGFWAYRFSILIDGKRISRKKTTDEFGGKLKTQAAAARARAAAITAAHIEMERKPRHENRPIGSFIFLGPTGVGKTELIKQH